MSKVRFGQSGYIGASRSVRADLAESEGKMPLIRATRAVAARASVTHKFARRILEDKLGPCEWHHVSKYANPVDYYDVDYAARFIAFNNATDQDAFDDEQDRLERKEAFRQKLIRNRNCSRPFPGGHFAAIDKWNARCRKAGIKPCAVGDLIEFARRVEGAKERQRAEAILAQIPGVKLYPSCNAPHAPLVVNIGPNVCQSLDPISALNLISL